MVKKTNGKTRQTRFDPVLLKWAIVLSAKTSHTVCSGISSIFLIPSLSFVLRENEELAGEQESTIGDVQTATIQSIHRELIKNDNIIIRGYLVFDTM